jgi:O-antigen/teichoic acid export membrane protein
MKENKLQKQPQKSTFTNDVLKMSLAPVSTQVLGIILMPIVTRLYAPDAFGLFQLYGSIVMPISVFVTMGYSSSIVLPQHDRVAANMLCVSLVSTVFITFLTIPLVWLSSGPILRFLKVPELGGYLWLIPINIFVIGLYMSLRFWNVRCKQFGRIAIAKISNAVVNKAILITAGFSGFATSGSLIIGGITGSFVMGGILGKRVWQKNKRLFKTTIRWHNIIQGIKRYRKFPLYNLPTDLISRFANSITIFLFSFYFSKKVIGYYGLGLMVLSVPMTFVGSSIAEVFYQKGARAKNEGTNTALVEKLFKQMVWISMPLFLIIAILGDHIFAFVFGTKWLEAGIYAQILSFKLFMSFIISPISSLANILEKQEIRLILYIITIVTSLISIITGGLLNNVYVALGLFSLLNGLVLFGFGLLIFRFIGLSLLKIFGILSKSFISCIPIVVILGLTKYYFKFSSVFLVIISVVAFIIYYILLLREDKLLRSMFMKIINKGKIR